MASVTEFTEDDVKKRSVIMVLGSMPRGSEFGIDCKIWKIGDKFKGIAAVPPGIHYLHYTAADAGNACHIGQLRMGFFVNVEVGGLLIYIWDTKSETLVPLEDRAELERYRRGVLRGAFEASLGPYPVAEYSLWCKLSNYINKKTIDKLEPVQKRVIASSKPLNCDEKERVGDNSCTGSGSVLSGASSHIFFTRLPSLMKKETRGAATKLSPIEITNHVFDKSDTLLRLLQKDYDYDFRLFLGEMQFAFVCFLVGQSFEAFDQWKGMVDLLCSSERALLGKEIPKEFFSHNITIVEIQEFLAQSLQVLKVHLEQIPLDFFDSDLSKGNFLEQCVTNLYLICIKDSLTDSGIGIQGGQDHVQCHENIRKEVMAILKFLQTSVGVDIEERYLHGNNLDEEDLPVVVDLDAAMF